MPKKPYDSAPAPISHMPPGIPYIIGNEAAERFSFYGMRAVLTIFMVKYLWLMGEKAGAQSSDAEAIATYHFFTAYVYLTPFLGAILADGFFGKYTVIIYLSLFYCLGHGALALMGTVGSAEMWLFIGLWLIIIGSGGIKPCVSAHVGDQFGAKNSHLLPKIFNWFYWSINLGAFVSSLLTPWLLEWHGPHWAFGVPGILMAIATLVFWIGRWKFVHIPAKGVGFIKEVFSREGIFALLKLTAIYAFVAIFWALFDQQGSSWVLQAEDMDRNWLGVEWLPSQIQAMNPILILTFIPLFSYVVYPAIDRIFPLTPLRKVGIGLFLMVVAFAFVSFAQEKIDAGETPSISWQLLGYVLMTASEVMVSIVCLEFSYTQAPRAMKSFVMALFLAAVFVGNQLTGIVNKAIQVDSPLVATAGEQSFAGFDGRKGTEDDITATYNEEGNRTAITFASKGSLDEAVAKLKKAVEKNGFRSLSAEEGTALLAGTKDPWGNPLRYTLVNRNQSRLTSIGPDGKYMTPWDEGALIQISVPSETKEGGWAKFTHHFRPDTPWLERRKAELGIPTNAEITESGATVSSTYFVGGQTRLEGASYFWFFTWLMLGSAVVFVVVAKFYKPREYLHEEIPATERA